MNESAATQRRRAGANALTREDFPASRRISLPDTVRAANVDDAVARLLSATDKPSTPVLLDLRGAKFIELSAITTAIAWVASMQRSGVDVYIGVPASHAVRNFLRLWRFPEALQAATQVPFRCFLLAEDGRYRGESVQTDSSRARLVKRLEYDPEWRPGKSTHRNFFEFTTHRLTGGELDDADSREANVPRLEGLRWSRGPIRAALKRYLGGPDPEDQVARVVIYEAISNCVRHPRATLMQYAALVDLPRSTRASSVRRGAKHGFLRVCFWDDGESIVTTLRKALTETGSVRQFRLAPALLASVLVRTRDHGEPFAAETAKLIHQADDPGEDCTDEELLVASFHPGITRAATRPVARTRPFAGESIGAQLQYPPADADGMGLFALMNTVVRHFQGSISVRTGALSMSIKPSFDRLRANEQVEFRCDITRYPSGAGDFPGNLLAMSLPLRRPPSGRGS